MQKGGKSYYGPFFWLALVSFIVPLFVAAKAFESATPASKPDSNPDASGVDHNLWDYLLKQYVADGLIDYEGMKRDHLFTTYIQQLGAADPAALATDDERLALLCNAYNALVVHGVIKNKIDDNVLEHKINGKGFFKAKDHIFANETLSLDNIEHDTIRVEYDEPRIHVALVCAARSCPTIRPEAYFGERLTAQLEDQMRLFANNPEYVAYNAEENALYVSALMDWYGHDFDSHGGYHVYIAERVDDPTLKEKLLAAGNKDIKTKHFKYDWTLNTQGEIGASKSANKPAEFGSGSIPNE